VLFTLYTKLSDIPRDELITMYTSDINTPHLNIGCSVRACQNEIF